MQIVQSPKWRSHKVRALNEYSTIVRSIDNISENKNNAEYISSKSKDLTSILDSDSCLKALTKI